MDILCDLYLRLSDDPHGDELAIDRQERECRELAARLGYTVDRVFADNDISATTGKVRPGFEALLAHVKESPRPVVTWHLDRLLRVSRDLERVIDLGVNVHAVTAGHLDLSTPAGRAVARTITAWSTYEGEQKALRMRAKYRQMAESGLPWWPKRPFGFEKDGKLRPDEASALHEIYRDVLAGVSLRSCARRLNEAGLITPYGNDWRAETLRPILLNPRNAGLRARNGEIVGKGRWEAIVSENLYQAVCGKLRDPERRDGPEGSRAPKHLLTSIATCGKCGGIIRGTVRQAYGSTARYLTYSCRAKHCVSVPLELADDVVRKAVLSLWPTEAPAVDTVREAALDAEIAAVRTRRKDLAMDYAAGLLPREAMVAGVKTADATLKALEEERASLTRETERALSLVPEALEGFMPQDRKLSLTGPQGPALDIDQQRAIVRRVVDRVLIQPVGRGRKATPSHVQVIPKAVVSLGG